SKIVDPTEGSFETTGRVASLLEVGTGFHPELTGRENLYFNGSILGMTQKEIGARFDEIVDFAEIGKFIDTPVKFYSSGMSVRLGFAIAAHLDPEVLIIDEALAVGDVAFQQKCIEKMRNSARSGKTVLFVSHSMNIIEDLCDRVMYLKNGKLVDIGDPDRVMSAYLGTTKKDVGTSWQIANDYVDKPDNPVRPLQMKLLHEDGKPIGPFINKGKPVVVDFEVDIKNLTSDLSVGVSVFNEVGVHMYRTATTDYPDQNLKLSPGTNHLQVVLPTSELLDGPYIVSLDCDIYKKQWAHNPYFSEMRTRFLVKADASDPVKTWEPSREGAYKPHLSWQKVS
ncbi:MAG TPA: ATP-binding cassette domain-containing protein, partial [Candidatus Saccharimonadales bacterium]|nr:ATP-binding cassette domain-containing protein [Candidatus Saccharimonadales bacterium]